MEVIVPPTSLIQRAISSLPLAMPHLGKYTVALSSNRSRMFPPLEVTPPWSKADRYSRATDLRCSSVMTLRSRDMAVSPYWIGDGAERSGVSATQDGPQRPAELRGG